MAVRRPGLFRTFALLWQIVAQSPKGTGHQMNWLPQAMHVLRDELRNIQVTIG